jgi:hypothetical protein
MNGGKGLFDVPRNQLFAVVAAARDVPAIQIREHRPNLCLDRYGLFAGYIFASHAPK